MDPKIEEALPKGMGVERIFARLEELVEGGLTRLGSKKDGEPIRELHIELTHRCNLKCIMCHHWEWPFRDPASVRREMTLEDIQKFVMESTHLKEVEIVVISGGEPMMKPEIVEVLGFLSDHYPKASVGVLTNFWNTELVRRRLVAFRKRGVRNLWLGSSLDGVGETHDKIRGQEGSFSGLMETVEMMRREFPEVHYSFSFTVTPKNHTELWKTYHFVTNLGLWFGAQMVVNHQEMEAPETFSWKEEEIRAVESQIDLIILDICNREKAWDRLQNGQGKDSLGLWTRLLYWWYLKKYARKPERFFKDCLAGQRYAMLDPEGNLFYCPVNKHRQIGNVKEKAFDAVWTSPKADSERKYVDSCSCDCWLNCIANPILDRAVALGVQRSRWVGG